MSRRPIGKRILDAVKKWTDELAYRVLSSTNSEIAENVAKTCIYIAYVFPSLILGVLWILFWKLNPEMLGAMVLMLLALVSTVVGGLMLFSVLEVALKKKTSREDT